ncbi:MAG TPA: orotidine-5'-phosphate decarboxylase, partial [Lacipirellulaceae bacterium]|nr:orotidine-5'-phosphate decarboxylase [Lacipirellulaceae bacterium]
MPGEHFTDKLAAAVRRCGNAVCVGLDPRWEQLPAPLIADSADGSVRARAYRDFCCGVIDAVAPLVPVVKPQAAFFEELGPPGVAALVDVIRYARQQGLLVILDAKRNDIGSTAEAYARGMLGRDSPWGADALTVSPYLGEDSLLPFVEVARQRGAGLFVLVKTSNPGGGLLQDLETLNPTERAGASRPRRLYHRVAQLVERLSAETAGASGYGLVGAVCGATYPEQLAELRAAMPHTWLLIPGYGSQGGAAADAAPGFDAAGLGAVVNNSRGLIFAHERPEYAAQFGHERWPEAVAAATRQMIEALA